MSVSSTQKASLNNASCPCGTGRSLLACCGRYHAGGAAPDAEHLMRSRYSAYVLGLNDYLRATWHSSTRPAEQQLAGGPALKWLGLEVRCFIETGEAASVSFVARYKQGGRAGRLVETSRFVREAGRWYYVDGDIQDA